MPPPIKVELLPHDPRWSDLARAETQRLADAIGPNLLIVHHIGSTAIPGICAKPIVDLIPVVRNLAEFDSHQRDLAARGYEWWGEFGLPGRRFCTKADPVTGTRLIHLHCYEDGSSEIVRHLAFRDYLRAHPTIAAAYDCEKDRCKGQHPDDSYAYSDCKDAWIKKAEADALRWYQHR